MSTEGPPVPPIPPPPSMPSSMPTGVPVEPQPPTRRRRGKTIIALGVVLIAVAGVAGYVSSRPSTPPGPPGAPTGVVAKSATCAPPRCHRIESTVTLTWSAPSGVTVTGYHVLRNGVPLPTGTNLPGSQTTFTDKTAAYDFRYTYQVTASSEGGTSPKSASVAAKAPEPPASAAQLKGDYSVRLTVQHTQLVGKVEGIKTPKPGDKTTETWRFSPVCSYDTGPCGTRVNDGRPPLSYHGHAYSGTVTGQQKANCFSDPKAPVENSYHLVTHGGRGSSGWLVRGFTGTYTVTFACGGIVSTATFTVKSI